VNSIKTTLYGDKLSLLELSEKGFPVPETYYFQEFNDFEKFLSNFNGNYVVKHRFTGDGLYNFLINKDNCHKLKNLDHGSCIGDFVVQPELDIESESRMIFFRDEFLGARIIHDRTRPWENKENSKRKHETRSYIPPTKELNLAKDFFKYIGADIGCVDVVHLKSGKSLILEYNGVGTGYGGMQSPYNLNNVVFSKLRDKFL